MGLPILGMIAGTALSTAAQYGANALTNNQNNATKYKQYEKIGKKQMEFNNEQRGYDLEWQKRFAHEAGYGLQVETMKEAGLNPAMMYGGAGNPGGNSMPATQLNVPDQSTEMQAPNIMQAEQMGMQIQLLKAQTDNINADTYNKLKSGGNQEAQADYTAGVLTQKGKEEASVIHKTGEKINEEIGLIAQQTNLEVQKVIQAERENQIGARTADDKILDIKATAIGKVLQNLQTKAQTSNIKKDTQLKGSQIKNINKDTQLKGSQIGVNQAQTQNINKDTELKGSQIEVNQQQIKASIQHLMIDWDRLGQQGRETRVQELMQEWNTDIDLRAQNQIMDILKMGVISGGLEGGHQPTIGSKKPF